MRPPAALMLDLDDTILDIAGSANIRWQIISAERAPALGIKPEQLYFNITRPVVAKGLLL